jgi:hypothetical protein
MLWRRTHTHVGEEAFKAAHAVLAVAPTVADFDAAAAVVFENGIVWIFTPLNHRRPSAVPATVVGLTSKEVTFAFLLKMGSAITSTRFPHTLNALPASYRAFDLMAIMASPSGKIMLEATCYSFFSANNLLH